ncbi:MAG: tectonin domain-containing protein [Pseudohongiellaceae bacterium]
MSKIMISAVLFCLLLPSLSSVAQQARLQENLLVIPYLTADARFYRAELEQIAGSDPARFSLLAVIEVAPNDGITPATYADGRLFIPHVELAGSSYWAELTLVSPNTFSLSNAGANAPVASNNPLGVSTQPNWQRLPGNASDIGVGANGAAWVIGNDERGGGYGIYQWNGTGWSRFPGGAVRIDVDPAGIPWIVNDREQIFRWVNNAWQRLPGNARDIGIGADGSVWVASDSGVYRWNGSNWEGLSGSAVRVDVDPAGLPWIINHDDDIYQFVGGRWVRHPGEGTDIGIGADGAVWLIGSARGPVGWDIGDLSGFGGQDDGDFGIYRWSGEGWRRVDGGGRQISADADGYPLVVSSNGDIYLGQ